MKPKIIVDNIFCVDASVPFCEMKRVMTDEGPGYEFRSCPEYKFVMIVDLHGLGAPSLVCSKDLINWSVCVGVTYGGEMHDVEDMLKDYQRSAYAEG